MSKLKKLIGKYCPNGVEYIRLKEICYVSIGEFVHKNKQSEDGKYPVFNGGRQNTGYYDEYNNTANKVIISARGANAGFVNKVYTNYWAGNSCYSLSPKDSQKLNWEYLFYSLKNKEQELLSNQQTGSIPALSKKQIEDFYIPLPPIIIQEEIVKILDRFAEYAAELQAELQARQEQYEYYRNKLLTFNEIGGIQGVIWMKMSEIGTFIRGNGLQKKDFTESGIPCIHYGQIYTHYGTFATKTKSYVSSETAKKCKKAHCGDLVFATVSENIDDVCKCVAWLGNEEICISGDSLAFAHNQNPKYIAYYFQTYAFARYKRSRVTGTKVIRLHQSQLEQFEIPIPSLAEQARIVNILDKFETLVSDLVQGLPAEIEAVQEQYEYYRNKLLSFPKYKLSA